MTAEELQIQIDELLKQISSLQEELVKFATYPFLRTPYLRANSTFPGASG